MITKIYEKEHKASNGIVQKFHQVEVSDEARKGLTYHDSLYTDWFLVNDGKLYVCDDEGECLVEYSAEYEGEDFPLSKYEKLTMCSNEKDFDYYHEMAVFAIKTIKDKFSVDVSELKIINEG